MVKKTLNRLRKEAGLPPHKHSLIYNYRVSSRRSRYEFVCKFCLTVFSYDKVAIRKGLLGERPITPELAAEFVWDSQRIA